MEMENQSSPVDSLIERVKIYIETRIDLLRLKAIDKSSSFLSLLFSIITVMLLCFIFIVILSFGIALLIGEMLGKPYYGFFIVAGFYLLVGIILFVLRNKLKTPIANSMIKNLTD